MPGPRRERGSGQRWEPGPSGRCTAAALPLPLPKWEAGPGWGYSWFPVTRVPGTAGRDRKGSAWASDHCGAGYVDFCIELEEN